MEEIFDVYTKEGIYLGKKEKSFCHSDNPGCYHKPVWIWIVNSKNEILVQKRAQCKRNYPGFFDMPSAGHVVHNETTIAGAIRETREELGIETKEEDYRFLFEYIFESAYEIAQVYLLKLDLEVDEFYLQKEEVELVKWLTFSEFKELFYSNDFVPFPKEYKDKIINLVCKK